MKRYYFADTISHFLQTTDNEILVELDRGSREFSSLYSTQGRAWDRELQDLRPMLGKYSGKGSIVFEYTIPRLGRRKVNAIKAVEKAKTKKVASSEVQAIIQMVHRYRKACLENTVEKDGKIVEDIEHRRSTTSNFIVWDADFQYTDGQWAYHKIGSKKDDDESVQCWRNINDPKLRLYQKNAYRVLLTRARQGMIICIPKGDSNDITRKPELYDSTYIYLKKVIGLEEMSDN